MTSKLGLTDVFTLFVLATLSACGGGGGGGSAAAPPPNNVPRFAFVANFNDNTVSSYTVNPTTGQLRHNGYVAAGIQPHSVTVHPSGKFVYVTNFGGTALSGYAVGSDGRLTSLFAPIGCANCAARGVTIDPTGKYLYIAYSATGANIVSAYVINADGTLTFIADDFSVTKPFSVTIDPAGRFAYVTSFGSAVHAFAIQANGALSSVDTDAATAGNQASIAAGVGTHAFTFDPAGRFAYTANYSDGSVSAYTVNATTGALTAVAGSPFMTGQSGSRSVSIDPSGKFAYVANNVSANVSAYAINATTGALTALAGSPFAAGANPGSVTVDPSGKFLYVPNSGSNTTTIFSLDAVTGVPGAARTVAGRNGNLEMAMTRGTTAVAYTPKFAYVANQNSNNVSAYSINATTGVLTSVGAAVAAGTLPFSVSVDPSGKFAYVANRNSANVSAYSINATTGALTPIDADPVTAGVQNFPAGIISGSVTVDPSGKFAYVANFGDCNVSAYTIDATTGVLTAMAGSPFDVVGGPSSVTVDPSGRFAYVASEDTANVSVFTIDATTGALTGVGAAVASGNGPFSVTTTGIIQ